MYVKQMHFYHQLIAGFYQTFLRLIFHSVLLSKEKCSTKIKLLEINKPQKTIWKIRNDYLFQQIGHKSIFWINKLRAFELILCIKMFYQFFCKEFILRIDLNLISKTNTQVVHETELLYSN